MSIQIGNISKQGNIYINKQTSANGRFNPNSIKNFINVKTIYKNIIHNLIHIFCLQMSIILGNVSKQGKNLYQQTNNNYGGI